MRACLKLWIIIFCVFIPSLAFGQTQSDSSVFVQKKNVIHWNLTPLLLWDGTNLVLAYERLINKSHSISVSFGFQEFPRYKNVGEEKISRVEYSRRTGYRAALEYRFYLDSRNVNPAPDGIYIGPYLSFFNFNLKNNLDVKLDSDITEELVFNGSLTRISLGFQLGYQFIIKDRFSIDLMMLGPSLTRNFGNLSLEGNISDEEKSELYEKMLNKIEDSFPSLINKLSNADLKRNGDFFNWGAGFRYMIQVGYAF